MNTLREAAQQALEALEGKRYTACGWRFDCDKAITALKVALAEPVQEPIRWDASAPLVVHPHPAFQTAPPQRKPLADGDNLSPTEPVAWYHVPHPGNGISPMVSMFQQHEPSLYAVAVPLFIREQL